MYSITNASLFIIIDKKSFNNEVIRNKQQHKISLDSTTKHLRHNILLFTTLGISPEGILKERCLVSYTQLLFESKTLSSACVELSERRLPQSLFDHELSCQSSGFDPLVKEHFPE